MQILQTLSMYKEWLPYKCGLCSETCLPRPPYIPLVKARWEGMGAWGEDRRERLFSLRCEKAGPSRAGGDRKAAVGRAC